LFVSTLFIRIAKKKHRGAMQLAIHADEIDAVHVSKKQKCDNLKVEGGGGGEGGAAPLTPFAAFMGCASIVFSFLDMRSIVQVVRVCKEWHTIVSEKMPCLEFKLTGSDNDNTRSHVAIAQSAFKNHISSIHYKSVMDSAKLYALHDCYHLDDIECTFESYDGPCVFPPSLVSCKLTLLFHKHTVGWAIDFVNAILRDLVRSVQTMDNLYLTIRLCNSLDSDERLNELINFKPLETLELNEFIIFFENADGTRMQPFLPRLFDVIQNMSQLTTLFLFSGHTNRLELDIRTLEYLAKRPPPQLSFLDLRGTTLCKRKIEVLTPFKQFTTVGPHFIADVTSFEWLASFPQCSVFYAYNDSMPIDVYTNEFRSLQRLERVRLYHPELTSVHLKKILSYLPKLVDLSINNCDKLTSLDWLDDKSCRAMLQKVTLLFCKNICPGQLRILQGETLLTDLIIRESFNVPLDKFTLGLFSPPSFFAPSLKKFEYLT